MACRCVLFACVSVLALAPLAGAQVAPGDGATGVRHPRIDLATGADDAAPDALPAQGVSAAAAVNAQQSSDPQPARPPEEELALLQEQIQSLRGQQQAAKADGPLNEKTQKQLELQQKQIETLEKMVRLLAKQLAQQPAGGAAVEKLQGQVATLESRSKQAAQRDKELADAVDNIVEHQDAVERNGPQLPANLKQLFLQSGNNETPLSIYGTLALGYNAPQNQNAGFFFGELSPDFFLKLNDWIFFEGEFSAGSDGSVSLTFAQVDFLVNDWLTIVVGRFVAPIGWYNERANNPWVNKLPIDAPDTPLLWRQVLPTLSCQGLQARGAHYLGDSPVKLEYAAYVSNGLNLSAPPASINDLANLENMESTFSYVTNDKAVGGRVGFWWPEVGLTGGLSGMYNGSYLPGSTDSIRLWAADLNYHKGNWDILTEYGMTNQDAEPFIHRNIGRWGLSAQVSYRPLDCNNHIIRNIEGVYRYGYVNFSGILPSALDPTTFSSPIDVPVRREQHTFGIDYWFSPRLVAQFAYEINHEFGRSLNDNIFMCELAWGW
jgi:hypothetical protein